MRKATQLGVLAAICAVLAVLGPVWLAPGAAWTGLNAAAVAVGLWTCRVRWMGKRDDGAIAGWSYAVFLPWHLITRVAYAVHRARFPPPAHEVAPALWVGGWPRHDDLPHPCAVIDATAELPRRASPARYLCVPAWDHGAPTLDDLDRAVAFARSARDAGLPVFVHCAHGRGRSATLAAAIAIDRGEAMDSGQAIERFRQIRAVRPHAEQRAALDGWLARRRGDPRDLLGE